MTTTVETREWRRYGFGGPPEPWEHDAQRDIDRLATSYYLDVMELRSQILAAHPDEELWLRVEELHTAATRHKHEIDYTLRHWATPVERARVADRLGALMRISRRLHAFVHGPHGPGDPEPEAAWRRGRWTGAHPRRMRRYPPPPTSAKRDSASEQEQQACLDAVPGLPICGGGQQ